MASKTIFQKRSILPIILVVFLAAAITRVGAQTTPQTYPAQPPVATPGQQNPSNPTTQPSPTQQPVPTPGQQPATTPPQQPVPTPGQQPATTPPPQPVQTPGQPSTANASGVQAGGTIAAGTLISITPTQRIQQAQAGASYPAEIAQNVADGNGGVLIPAGSPAQLTVVNAVSPSGASELALALRSVTVNGRTYNVFTNSAQNAAGGQTNSAQPQASNAVPTAGILGTLVGVLGANGQAGGASQGAQASSGALGSLGGVLGQILTRGTQVNVPAQSQLTFRLDQPLQLQ